MDDLDMISYAVITETKNEIINMISKTELVDINEIDDNDLDEAVKFLYTVDLNLLGEDVSAKEQIIRLRNLVVTLFVLIQQGEDLG